MIDIKEFYRKEIAWQKKEIDWYTRQIEWCTDQLKRSRKQDNDLVEYVWSKGPVRWFEKDIYVPGKYESCETHDLKLERRKYYLRRKKACATLEKYKKALAEEVVV